MTLISRHHIKNFRRSEPRRGAFFLSFFSTVALPAIILAMLLPTLVNAATDTKPSPLSLEDARWFQVELILFAQKKGEPLESEQWPEIEGLTLPETLLELHLPPVESMDEEAETLPDPSQPPELSAESNMEDEPPADPSSANVPELPVAYQLLGDDALQLTEIAEKIRRSSRFNTLLHIAWQQPTYDRQHAQPVFFMEGMSDPLPTEATDDATEEDGLSGDQAQSETTPPTGKSQFAPLLEYATEEDTKIGPPNPQFVGTVTLSVERYLHLATDLLYRRPVTQHLAIPISDLDLWYDRPHPTLKEPQGPAYRQETWQAQRGFRFVESRRMRSTEIHYLDHPFMGLVVVITPVELPEPAEEIQQTSPQNILMTPRK